MTTTPPPTDPLREAAQAFLDADSVEPGPKRVAARGTARFALMAALAATAPAPDLLAAVEALRKIATVLDQSGGDRYAIEARSIAREALRSAPASREAGLDAERLARDVMKRIAGLGYKTDGTVEVVARSQVYRVIHEAFSALASREAGLDAKHIPNVGGYCDGSGLYVECSCGWAESDYAPKWIDHARLTSSPVTDSERA